MRDAFGSTFMFRLIIIFIVFYVCFATIAVSYAKTFRLKNRVVDIVEQYQYNHLAENDYNKIVFEKINGYLEKSNYNYKSVVSSACTSSGNDAVVTDAGACILPKPYGKNRYYYKVTVYMIIRFPVFSRTFVIPVSGDTDDYL